MPGSWALARSSSFWLLSRLRAAKGPLAFVDESFRSPSEAKDSFYILYAVVIPKSNLFKVRNTLREIVGKDYFHATESGRREDGQMLIRKMARYLSQEVRPVLVIIEQLAKSDRDAEAGREQATRALWKELSENELYLTGTVVYERRMRGVQDRSDLRIFNTLRRLKLPGSKLNVIGVATKNEPLLWAPDLVAWAFRQAYDDADNSYFNSLTRVTKIIKL